MMGRLKKTKSDDAATHPRDWVGAAEVRPNERPRPKGNPLTFFLYAASNDPTLFVATARSDKTGLPSCPGKGRWHFFKSFRETGQPRIGFDEAAARQDIAAKGYHLLRVKIDTAEIVSRKSA